MHLITFLEFPNFNIRSTPLLLLVLQGLIFVGLLLYRYWSKRNISDLFLGLILGIVCYEQTCYTVGFMDWYDTYRNTKINYWLISMSVATAPLIYFYVKSITTSDFVFKKKDWWHFVLAIGLIVYRIVIFTYDALQPGFSDTQNGFLKINLDEAVVLPAMSFISFVQMLLYLAFTFQLFYFYRRKINEYFSNTYKLELKWILSFLIAFSLLFLYSSGQDIISSFYTELSYTQRYWLNIFMAIVTLYVGVRGYFTNTAKLKKLNFSFSPNPISIPENNEGVKVATEDVDMVKIYMETEKPYLDPELNLIALSRKLNLTRSQLSQIVNEGFGVNFNDFVNSYRVQEVKKMFEEGKQNKLSLLGIAMECGFNSKATFNRVFKKVTGASPTVYLQK